MYPEQRSLEIVRCVAEAFAPYLKKQSLPRRWWNRCVYLCRLWIVRRVIRPTPNFVSYYICWPDGEAELGGINPECLRSAVTNRYIGRQTPYDPMPTTVSSHQVH